MYIAAAPALLTLSDVERVEVFKGPQGTLFCRDATGGLIQVVTRDPSDTIGGAFNLSSANYRTITADAYVTGGLAPNLAADPAVRYQHGDQGWGRNLATGNQTGGLDHDYAGRAKFLWSPGADTHVRLALDYEGRLHARFTSFANADFVAPIPGFPPNPGAVVPGSAKGRTLPFAPTFTGDAGVDHRLATGVRTSALNGT